MHNIRPTSTYREGTWSYATFDKGELKAWASDPLSERAVVRQADGQVIGFIHPRQISSWLESQEELGIDPIQ